jgi:hypothetical protein
MLKSVSLLVAMFFTAGSFLISQEIIVAKQGNLIEPCNLLGSSFIKDLMKNDQIIVVSKKYAASTSCIFDWLKSNVEEINKKNEELEAIAEKNSQTARLINKYNNITITFEKRFSNSEEAETEFNKMINNLEKGITTDTKGLKQLVTAKFDRKAENIGDINAWSSQLYQLSVKSGKYLYHVKVSVSDNMDENFEISKKIAEELEKKLKTL